MKEEICSLVLFLYIMLFLESGLLLLLNIDVVYVNLVIEIGEEKLRVVRLFVLGKRNLLLEEILDYFLLLERLWVGCSKDAVGVINEDLGIGMWLGLLNKEFWWDILIELCIGIVELWEIVKRCWEILLLDKV